MGQVVSEIEHSYLLRFPGPDLAGNSDYVVQLRMNSGATTVTSNERSVRTP